MLNIFLIILKMLEKLCHVNFFKFDFFLNVKYKKKGKHQHHQVKKKLGVMFGFFIIYIFLIELEKVYKRLTFKGFFRKT